MMASSNLDHTHQDHDLNWCISSSLFSHDWINKSLMNYNDHTPNFNELLRGSINHQKELRATNLIELPPSLSQIMVQDLGFHGSIQGIKEVITEENLPRLYGAIHEHYQMIDEKLLVRALQNSTTHNLLLPSTEDFFPNNESSINCYANFTDGGNNYSMVSHPLPLPGILDMDLHAFDIFSASRFNTKPLMVREDAIFRAPLMQELFQGTCTINQPKIPSLLNGVAEKRAASNCILDNKTPIPKKSRFEPRSSSFSSFKVRKEKLGDRIAALQQLVAPFGKTDTASVLMEAIGYIKFLQDQVETLSVPYLRLSRNKKQRTTEGEASEEKEEAKKLDLRSRGLCLVPLSCTSYVTNENGGVWSCSNFRGG